VGITTTHYGLTIFPYNAEGSKGIYVQCSFGIGLQPLEAIRDILCDRIAHRMLAELETKGKTQWTKDMLITSEGIIWQKKNLQMPFNEIANVSEGYCWSGRYYCINGRGKKTVNVLMDDENFYPGLMVIMTLYDEKMSCK